MKTIEILLLLSLSLILFSCGDDDKNVKLDSLKQTSWKGEFIREKDGKEIRKGNVGIEFTTGEYGLFSLIFEDKPDTDYGARFTYTIDGKLLVMQTGAGYDRDIDGNWLIVSNTKNTLILQKGTSNEGGEKNTMTLKKAI